MFKTPFNILQEWKKNHYIKEDNGKYFVTKYFENIIENENHIETEIESDLMSFWKKEFTFKEWENRDLDSR